MANYPLVKFNFLVEWNGARMAFTEVSGLDFETEAIEYREGNMKQYNKIKVPGMTKFSNITLKRGTFEGDYDFYTWWQETQNLNSHEGRDVTIKLLSEAQEPLVTWNVTKAWPTKFQSTDLKSDGNEIAIETLELAHDGLTIQT